VFTELQVSVNPCFQCGQPKLLKPPDPGLRKVLKRNIRQGRTTPELQRPTQQRRRVRRVSGVESALAVPELRLKYPSIEVVGRDREQIAAADGPEGRPIASQRLERLTEPSDRHVQRLDSR
jgi:hypothetical protein